ncbi:NADPH-dependent FMN reductase [Falsigemmobacter faecalis]|uniref:NADPH-dependent oxidoreductase n=1 Tax=Falsigemmobacter faecalis TaxID=2488730 RepID=A0A3P3DCZ2_9RHOB|nr:NAD(P)H-dependent oxidoreductase [Falsigemmobacter faecalis]RRH72197.1 NADPH-dependent oxidoreductase [Falsigemmobacter faecalis]
MTKLRIALVIGTTRATRFADIPADWLLDQLKDHPDLAVEKVDLRDFNLPLFDEPASNLWMPSSDPAAVAWQKKIGEFDGYIFTVAEYNRSIPGALKNAMDQAYNEWNKKPMSAIAYGGTGAARALEHLRNISVELQMVPARNAVHIAAGDFFKVHPGMGGSGNMADIEENLKGSVKAMADDLVWWGKATKAARG